MIVDILKNVFQRRRSKVIMSVFWG